MIDDLTMTKTGEAADHQTRICLPQSLDGLFHMPFFFSVPAGDLCIGLYRKVRLCRRTVAVLAPTETRVRRIMARDGISEDYARLRVQAQKPDEFYRARCTDVLMNDAASPQVFEEIAYQRLQHIFEEEADHE